MQTDDLIRNLAGDLKATRPFWKPGKLTLVFGIFAVVFAGIFASVTSIRGGLAESLARPGFLFLVIAAILLAIFGFLLAVQAAIPGKRVPRWQSGAGAFWLLGPTAYEFFRTVLLDGEGRARGMSPASGFDCFLVVAISSFVVGAAVFAIIRKRAPVNLAFAGTFTALAGLGVGQLSIALHCSSENDAHLFAWHLLLPAIASLAIGVICGRRFLRW